MRVLLAPAAGIVCAAMVVFASPDAAAQAGTGLFGGLRNAEVEPVLDQGTFIAEVAQSALVTTAAARLALTKAGDARVRRFAQQALQAQASQAGALRSLAAAKSVALPDDFSIGQTIDMQALSAADGPSFDRRYADHAAQSHLALAHLFQRAAASQRDREMKAYVDKMMPRATRGLRDAQALQRAMERKAATAR